MIIIPDVHGRVFWKDAISKRRENEKVVFLGDYLDPYYHEGIDAKQALENFKEILEYLKENKETTIALLGNHDCMTYLSEEMGDCRTDFQNAPIIGKMFRDNLDLFKVAWLTEPIGEKRFLFSHSALLKDWVDFNTRGNVRRPAFFKSSKNIDDIVGALESGLRESQDALWHVLGQVSWYRGGFCDTGSIVWADISELPYEEEWPGVYMIFGHSQRQSDPVISKHWACLDCRRAFRLTEDGEIKEL